MFNFFSNQRHFKLASELDEVMGMWTKRILKIIEMKKSLISDIQSTIHQGGAVVIKNTIVDNHHNFYFRYNSEINFVFLITVIDKLNCTNSIQCVGENRYNGITINFDMLSNQHQVILTREVKPDAIELAKQLEKLDKNKYLSKTI
ncbi:hypothetical protein [Candidatus Pelagibacter sp. HIMB1517]|uniref:hypothetical protein n=1 Tax=Candidatus Pelagibacter sp. HIMB1517 TaxID=3413341 RepID=UPI003F873DAB